jgi:hypothetical protein
METTRKLVALNILGLVLMLTSARIGAQAGPNRNVDCCKTTTEKTKFCCSLCCLDSGACPTGPNGPCGGGWGGDEEVAQ